MFIQQNRNKAAVLLLVLLVVFSFSSCAGLGDWRYYLPNGYAIIRVSAESVCLGKVENENAASLVIGPHIKEFCYNDSYVGVKKIAVDPRSSHAETETELSKELEYYLLNLESGEVYGPFTETEYEKKLIENAVGDMCEWIKTDSKPEQ